MTEVPTTPRGTTRRRHILAGLGAVGAALGLAACGSEGGHGGDDGDRGDASGPTPAGEQSSAPLRTDAVPVGGGIVLTRQDTVVTQPTEGTFKAFAATCTHQACFVSRVSAGEITCDCHGSRFSALDGSVTVPAPGMTPQTQPPLPAKSITIADGVISIG